MKILNYIIGGIIILAAYILLNFYIGLRGWQSLVSRIPHFNVRLYWLIFWMPPLSIFIGMLTMRVLPSYLKTFILHIGNYWMAVMVYMGISIAVIDLAGLLIKLSGNATFANTSKMSAAAGITAVILTLIIIVYGAWNANTPRVSGYSIKISKNAGSFNRLHAVMVSDIHLGTEVGVKRLNEMVSNINKLNPDIVFIAGDIVDSNISPLQNDDIILTMSKLKPKYGVYASPGNHEYYSGSNIDDIALHLKKADVQLLKDEYVEIEDSFYIAGHDDLESEKINRKPCKKLSEFMLDINKSLPVILLDHQPKHLQEASDFKIDLQLSGHTHEGQLWPGKLFTHALFEVDHGLLTKGSTHIIVTSGYGTWGPPIRVGTCSEIVDIYIDFNH